MPRAAIAPAICPAIKYCPSYDLNQGHYLNTVFDLNRILGDWTLWLDFLKFQCMISNARHGIGLRVEG